MYLPFNTIQGEASNKIPMFIESHHSGSRAGRIEIICGCMFSGKTEELIRRLRRAESAQQRVMLFKPAIDVRYHASEVVSHNRHTRMQGIPVNNAAGILQHAGDAEVVGIDEAQFFDDGLPAMAESLAGRGICVIIAGLDMDFKGEPFGPMPQLLARAEYIAKLHAICACCGGLASYSWRKSGESGKILIGEQDAYEARCRSCFFGESGL